MEWWTVSPFSEETTMRQDHIHQDLAFSVHSVGDGPGIIPAGYGPEIVPIGTASLSTEERCRPQNA